MIGKIIITLIALSAVAVWLDAVRAALNSISGGFVRSLDSEDKKVQAEKWLDQKKELGFTLRSLSFLTTVTFTSYIYFHSLIRPFVLFKSEWAGIKNYILFALILILFLIFKETLGSIWFSYYRYNLLRYSLPIINIMRIPLKPYELILVYSFNKAHERDKISSEEQEVSAEDEILSLVEKDEQGKLEEDEIRMIKGVFDLNDRVVREAMTPRVKVVAISSECNIEEAKEQFVESSYSRLPVYHEKIDNIIGILYAKDFLDKNKVESNKLENIIHPASFIQENVPLDDLLEQFKRSQNHFAVVNDQYGGTSGIITIEDVLEEIVGDIRDEYDDEKDEHELVVNEDGSLTTDANVNLEEINRLKPDYLISTSDDYETIGGCIYSKISRIPSVGENIELTTYTAKILDADERSIKRLLLIPTEPLDESVVNS